MIFTEEFEVWLKTSPYHYNPIEMRWCGWVKKGVVEGNRIRYKDWYAILDRKKIEREFERSKIPLAKFAQ